jgi:hypothetical protein
MKLIPIKVLILLFATQLLACEAKGPREVTKELRATADRLRAESDAFALENADLLSQIRASDVPTVLDKLSAMKAKEQAAIKDIEKARQQREEILLATEGLKKEHQAYKKRFMVEP